MTTATKQEIRNLIRDYLAGSEEADPASIVDDVINDLESETLMEAARFGVSILAHEIVRGERNHTIRSNESGKWGAAAEAAAEHRDVFMDRICVGYDDQRQGIWKFLGDCTKQDLFGAAAIKEKQAETMTETANRYKKLARELGDDKVVTDIEREHVEAVLYR